MEQEPCGGHGMPGGANLRLVCLLALWSSCGLPAGAATITVGDHRLLPNRPSQAVPLRVEGGDLVAGIDLFVQVGDAGPELAEFGLPPGALGPAITGVELIQGTIFQGITDPVTDIGSSQLKQTALHTLALVGPVPAMPAEGLLATLTLDTSGLFQGTWELILSGVLPHTVFRGPHTSSFAGQGSTLIQNGSLTIAAAPLRAGDANRDLVFDQHDLVGVLQAGKYLTGQPATWGQGDWNGAPGGSPVSPPLGDGVFDQSDIVAALRDAAYRTGPYAAAVSEGQISSGPTSLTAKLFQPQERLPRDRAATGPLLGDSTLAAEGIGPAYAPVPEPQTALLLLVGLATAAGWSSLRGYSR